MGWMAKAIPTCSPLLGLRQNDHWPDMSGRRSLWRRRVRGCWGCGGMRLPLPFRERAGVRGREDVCPARLRSLLRCDLLFAEAKFR
jgi:hypothetical protein